MIDVVGTPVPWWVFLPFYIIVLSAVAMLAFKITLGLLYWFDKEVKEQVRVREETENVGNMSKDQRIKLLEGQKQYQYELANTWRTKYEFVVGSGAHSCCICGRKDNIDVWLLVDENGIENRRRISEVMNLLDHCIDPGARLCLWCQDRILLEKGLNFKCELEYLGAALETKWRGFVAE